MRSVIQSLQRRLPTRTGTSAFAPLDGLRPADVRAMAMSTVLGRLAERGIPHTVVPAALPTRTCVVVPAERVADLAAALSALPCPQDFRCTLPADAPRADASPVDGRAADTADASRPLTALTARDLSSARVVRVFSARAAGASGNGLVYGPEYGCDVELWEADPLRPGWRTAPRSGGFASAAEERSILESVPSEWCGHRVPLARAAAECASIDEITFPVDVVYLWVDGSDPAWSERMHRHRGTKAEVRPDSERFRQMEELRYSLRSLDMYAPWVRRIFVVTDDQTPSFLRTDERLTIVDHHHIADDLDRLPTYNSDAISSWMHRIPDLAEHFLFLNDDMFFGRDVQPGHFFTPAGQIRVFPSRNQRPLGPPAEGDDLPDAKAKNLAAAIEREFGKRPVNIVRHTPYPMTRSLVRLVEDRIAVELERTRSHRFREPTDVPIEQAVHYVGQVTGDAVRSPIGYGYMNITTASGVAEFRRLVDRRDRDVFCLNDAPDGTGAAPDVDLIRSLLERMYPVPSRWEVEE